MAEVIKINAPEVTISVGRWNVVITAKYSSGNTSKWIISADHGYTEGDGIYFATEEEHKKYLKETW